MNTPLTTVRDKIYNLLMGSPYLSWGSMINRIDIIDENVLVVYSDNDDQTDKRHFTITVAEEPGW